MQKEDIYKKEPYTERRQIQIEYIQRVKIDQNKKYMGNNDKEKRHI